MIFYLKQENYQEYKNGKPENISGENFFVLYSDGWNDFGFYTTYYLVYYFDRRHKLEIGTLKICHQEMDDFHNKTSEYLSKEFPDGVFSSLPEEFCSLAQDTSFYDNLAQTGPHDSAFTEQLNFLINNAVLLSLNEATFLSPSKIKRFEGLEVFNKSLLRDFGEGSFILELTKFKNEIDNSTDTFSFLNRLGDYFDIILSKRNLSGKFLTIAKKYSDNFLLSSKAVEYIKYHHIQKRNRDLLDQIKAEFLDRPSLVKEIDELLDENEELHAIIDKIKDYLRISKEDFEKDDSLKLGHYTSIDTVKYLISKEKNSLRLTNSRQLNDPMEGKVLFEYLFGNDTTTEFIPSHVYLASATTELDSLPMWKQYAGNADGVSLVYDRNYLRAILESSDIEISRVCYFDFENESIKIDDPEMEKLLKELKESINGDKSDEIKALLNPISFLFKKREYSYEKEYRIMLDTDKNPGISRKIECFQREGFPFPFLYTFIDGISLKYSTIKLGPKSMDIDYIAPYLKYCDEGIKITKSKISFR